MVRRVSPRSPNSRMRIRSRMRPSIRGLADGVDVPQDAGESLDGERLDLGIYVRRPGHQAMTTCPRFFQHQLHMPGAARLANDAEEAPTHADHRPDVMEQLVGADPVAADVVKEGVYPAHGLGLIEGHACVPPVGIIR